MMGYLGPLGCIGLGSTDIHMLVDLHGIGPDDFSMERLCQKNGKSGLSDPGGTAYCNDFFHGATVRKGFVR
jgi:hypothetical protein